MINLVDMNLSKEVGDLRIRQTWEGTTEIIFYTPDTDKDHQMVSTKMELTLQEVKELAGILIYMIKNPKKTEL